MRAINRQSTAASLIIERTGTQKDVSLIGDGEVLNKSAGMRCFRTFCTLQEAESAVSLLAGLASGGKDENRVAAQQVSGIVFGYNKAKMEILVQYRVPRILPSEFM